MKVNGYEFVEVLLDDAHPELPAELH